MVLVSWNGMICGLARNGEATKASDVFDEMVRRHQGVVAPNSVTFVGVLTACGHGGLVHRGLTFRKDMFHKNIPLSLNLSTTLVLWIYWLELDY